MAGKDKDLKRMSRTELIEIIYQLKKNEERLRERVEYLEQAVHDRTIKIERAGSIAEASVGLEDLFGAAQRSADLYLEEIKGRRENIEADCEKLLEIARKTAGSILGGAQQEKALLEMQCEELRTELQKLQEQSADLKTNHETIEE